VTLRSLAAAGALVAIAGAAGASVAADGAAPAPREQVGAHLSWVRDDGSAACPDAAAIEAEVAARLGDNPFARPPSQFIEAIVTRLGDRLQVAIAMRGPDGKLFGSRSLASPAGDCRSIATAAALTIAILIDPDALLRAPPPAPPPPPPAPPPPRPPALPRARVTALAVGGWGALPGPAFGAALAGTFDLGAHAAVGLTGGFFPEQRAAPPNDGFAFGLSYVEAIACIVPLGASARLRWELGAGLSAGLLHAVVDGVTPVNPGERWTFAATQLTRVAIPILRAGVLEAGVELAEPFPRRAFFVEGRPPGMDTVFTQPAVGVTGFVGAGMRWR
jgi:hypothetical protein